MKELFFKIFFIVSILAFVAILLLNELRIFEGMFLAAIIGVVAAVVICLIYIVYWDGTLQSMEYTNIGKQNLQPFEIDGKRYEAIDTGNTYIIKIYGELKYISKISLKNTNDTDSDTVLFQERRLPANVENNVGNTWFESDESNIIINVDNSKILVIKGLETPFK